MHSEQLHGSGQGRVPLLGQPARHRLPPHERYPLQAGALRSTCRRWCSATWAIRLRHGRCVHPRPGHRRKEALRRISDERPGRGRCCRYPTRRSRISQLAGTGMPEVYEQFAEIANTLENHYRDMQDMEFTIEGGKLYMLQTRNGKRTAHGRSEDRR